MIWQVRYAIRTFLISKFEALKKYFSTYTKITASSGISCATGCIDLQFFIAALANPLLSHSPLWRKWAEVSALERLLGAV